MMPSFEVELVRTIRTTVTVDAASAAEIKRRVADRFDGYADDLWHDGTDESDDIRVISVRRI